MDWFLYDNGFRHERVNKVSGLRPAALLKKRLWHRCFPVNLVAASVSCTLVGYILKIIKRTIVSVFRRLYDQS